MITQFPQRNLLATRPAHIPADSIIFNAPRPIYGSECWQGDFCSGIFYAAVHVDNPDRAFCIKQNKSLDARVLAYVTESEARQMVADYYASRRYKVTQAQMDEYWRDCFYQHFGETEIEIES